MNLPSLPNEVFVGQNMKTVEMRILEEIKQTNAYLKTLIAVVSRAYPKAGKSKNRKGIKKR